MERSAENLADALHQPAVDLALFVYAAFLLLIAAWQAFEHSYWISMAMFLWGGVGAL
jgi:hypothetical protein